MEFNITFEPGNIGLNFKGNKVCSVARDSQADKFGVEIGWKVVAVHREPVPRHRDYIIAACRKFAGRPVKITFIVARTKKRRRKHSESENIDLENRREITFEPGIIGIAYNKNIIVHVSPHSQAAKAGICIGWIIKKVNNKSKFKNTHAVTKALMKTKKRGKPTVICFQKPTASKKILLMSNKNVPNGQKNDRECPFSFSWMSSTFIIPWWIKKSEKKKLRWVMLTMLSPLPLKIVQLIISYSQHVPNPGPLIALASTTEANFENRNIEDQRASSLGYWLKYNNTVTKMNLSHNDIGPIGARGLAEGLKLNTTLKSLDMRNNKKNL